jgi:hypothetical protein
LKRSGMPFKAANTCGHHHNNSRTEDRNMAHRSRSASRASSSV